MCERFIAFLVDKSIVKVIHISTTEMLADGLTKPLSIERHHHHAEHMGLDLNLLYTCGTCKSVFHSKNDFDNHIAVQGHDDEFTIGGKKKRALQENISGKKQRRSISEDLVSTEPLGTEAIQGNG